MPIIFHSGLPGSGKTLHAIKYGARVGAGNRPAD